MSSRIPLSLFFCIFLMGATSCGGRSTDGISGRIQVTADQSLRPIAQANIRVRPLNPAEEAKGADEQPEDPSNLRGVSITNDAGYFEVLGLASDQTFQEYGLLRDWKYEIQIQVPGYYTYVGKFSYSKGAQDIQITLEEKDPNVTDDTGTLEINEDSIQVGSVRRG